MAAEVVASVRPSGPAELVRLARLAATDGADWLELRLDDWPKDADLARLGSLPLPVLVACRLPRDGGGFPGSNEERHRLLERALAGGALGIDLEDWEEWTPGPRQGPQRWIRSFHDWTGVPQDLPRIRDRLLARGAHVAKIVVAVEDFADAAPLLDLLASTEQRREPTVAFAAGAPGWPTRVLACVLGAPMVYGCVEQGTETAPGQVPIDLLIGLLRVRHLGARTRVLGLLGQPALHSDGLWLHNRALRRLGVDAVYLPFETARPEAVVATLRGPRLRGLSVTAPHKERMLPSCHRLDPVAEGVGAVNTLTFEAGGQVVGANTDVEGVVAALARAGADHGEGRPAAVLGTGGAARAAAVALERLRYAVTVLGRTAPSWAAAARPRAWQVEPLSERVLERLEPAVTVHATPVGGEGRGDEGERVVPGWSPPRGSIVLDMVYRPRVTRLLRDAAAAGAVAIRGVEMFVGQAAAQLERFTGARLPADELRCTLPEG